MSIVLKPSAVPILGLLTWYPMSGYEIRSRIAASTSNFWSESYGQLYPQLKVLRDSGLIAEQESAPEGQRKKRVYEITDAGRQALREWLGQPPSSRPPRNELLLKLFFASSGEAEAIREHCQAAREEAVQTLKRYEAIAEMLEETSSQHEDGVYWKMTIDLGLAQTRTFLAWSDRVLETLK